MREGKAKENHKEHVCIIQRAVLGTRSWPEPSCFTVQCLWNVQCAHGLQPCLLVTLASKGHGCSMPTHTRPYWRPPWSLHPRWHCTAPCELLCLLPASVSYYRCTPRHDADVSHISWKSSTALLSGYRSCLTGAFVPRLTSSTSISPIPISDLNTVLVFAIPLCIVSD